jgi:hypothetical protein
MTNAEALAGTKTVNPVTEEPVGQSAIKIQPSSLDPVDRRIMLVVSAMLTLIAIMMVTCVGLEWQKYDTAIGVAVKQSPPDHAAALSYERALDAAVTKTSALMLAFIVVFLGALYVLRTATAVFNIWLSGGGVNGALQSTSPGLVMVALGLVTVAIVVLGHSDINYTAPPRAISVEAVAPPDQNAEQEVNRGHAAATLPLEKSDGGGK